MTDESQVVVEETPDQIEEAINSTEVVEEIVEVDTSVASLFEGEEISEEFKNKVSVVFAAAVAEQVEKKVAALTEELTEKVSSEMEATLESQVEDIVENLDKYLDYVVGQWMEENEVAVETGIKVEMAESLMTGLKSLFEEHNLEIDEETHDVVTSLEQEIADLKEASNDLINANIELQSSVVDMNAVKVFEDITEGLTDVEVERFKTLATNLDKKDLEGYSVNLKTIKESFFAEAPVKTDTLSDEEEAIITEDTVAVAIAPSSDNPSVNALVEALNARKNK